MKKLVFVLLLLVPMVAVADKRSDFVNKILEYENTQIDNNAARINTYGVNQEKLDMYRAAYPRYNFPKNIKDLNEKQAKQILSYFWDNYRFSDYKYDEIQEKVWDIRQWRLSTYVPYYNGDNLANVLGSHYEYHPEFAPTSDILAGYKDKKITWAEYEKMYRELLQRRNPLQNCDVFKLDRICLLCTEKSALQCHRRLAAEYITEQLPDIEIVHL